MSNVVGDTSTADPGMAGRRKALLIPAVAATCFSGALLGLSILLLLIGVLVSQSRLAESPDGLTYLPRSGFGNTLIALQSLGPVAVGVALLFLMWLYRGRGQVLPTALYAVGAALVSTVPFL